MKKLTEAKTLLLAVAFCLASAQTFAQAAPKIALIDLKKVFDGYYKTKQADTQLKERAGDSEKVLKGMIDDYQKASEDYRKLIDGANDQAVSSDERDKRKKNAETKLLEIQEIEKSVQQYRRSTQETLETQKRRMRDGILKDIRDEVNKKARAGNYSLVLDTAAESKNETPILMYNNGQNDLTEEVLSILNIAAPQGSLTSGDDKKSESPLDVTKEKSVIDPLRGPTKPEKK